MTARLLLRISVTLAVLLGMHAPAFAQLTLSCGTIPKITRYMLKRHVLLHEFDREFRLRVAKTYFKRIDPSRTLFLDNEVVRIRGRLMRILVEIGRGNCAGLDFLNEVRRERIEYVEEYVKSELTGEGWKLDDTVEFTIDAKKRGYPKSREDRDALYSSLIQFRIASMIKAGSDLEKAKRRVIHRYELLSRRARELETRDIYAILLDSVAKALDPHSSYLSAERLEDFKISSTLALEGIGAQLRSQDGYAMVVGIIPGAPADRQGQLQPKDRITAVAQDSEAPVDVIDWSLRDTVRLIRGPKGTKVHLTVLREGETVETFQITIVRDKVDLSQRAAKLRMHTVERDGKPVKLAIIELPSFYGNNRTPGARQSDDDVMKHLREARKQGARGVLLDLSRNSGGLLTQAVKITGLFVESGGVVQVRDAQNGHKTLRDDDGQIAWEGPLVVLTSRRSASASEIVSAALQDHRRAVVAGDGQTHGKGTVQTVLRLRNALGAVKVTTGFFFRPNGGSIQQLGVKSDVVIPPAYNTDGMGESKRTYALPNRTIEPLPELGEDGTERSWKRLTRERIARLVERSRARVAGSSKFRKVAERIEAARARAKKGIARIAELLKVGSKNKSAVKKDDPPAAADGVGDGVRAKADGETKPQKPLSIYRLEALEILADHVVLGG